MRQSRFFLVIFYVFLMLEGLYAQKRVVKQLFSKIDLEPQFELPDGNKIALMGYTELLGQSISIPGPLLEFGEGDSVTLILNNYSQGAPHTIHLHGLDANQANDGVPELSFSVKHLEQGKYEFVAKHPGTYLYHCHVVSPIHVQAGMYGVIVIHPKLYGKIYGYSYEGKEYTFLTSEIDTHWHTKEFIQHAYDSNHTEISIPDYHPQYLMLNGKSNSDFLFDHIEVFSDYPRRHYNSLLHFANIGNCGNRFIFPSGFLARVVSTDGRPIPEGVDTVNILEVMPGERYDILLSNESLDNLLDSGIILVEYFDLNNSKVLGVQKIRIVHIDLPVVEKHVKQHARIFPNPTSDIFEITLGKIKVNQVKKTTLISIDGNKLKSYESFQKSFDLTGFPDGVYILQLHFDQTISTHKIIKH